MQNEQNSALKPSEIFYILAGKRQQNALCMSGARACKNSVG